jgi:hypothetical protein
MIDGGEAVPASVILLQKSASRKREATGETRRLHSESLFPAF